MFFARFSVVECSSFLTHRQTISKIHKNESCIMLNSVWKIRDLIDLACGIDLNPSFNIVINIFVNSSKCQ